MTPKSLHCVSHFTPRRGGVSQFLIKARANEFCPCDLIPLQPEDDNTRRLDSVLLSAPGEWNIRFLKEENKPIKVMVVARGGLQPERPRHMCTGALLRSAGLGVRLHGEEGCG